MDPLCENLTDLDDSTANILAAMENEAEVIESDEDRSVHGQES